MVARFKSIEGNSPDFKGDVVRLVNRHGQHKAAEILGTSAATINRWLKANRVRKKIIYVDESEEST